MAEGRRFAVVTTPLVRRPLWALLRVRLPQPVVMSFVEIPDDRTVDVVAVVGGRGADSPTPNPSRKREGSLSPEQGA
jgi:flagellar biosynthesis protein FlhA